MSYLPDHTARVRRQKIVTGSAILHAEPEKAAELINDILAGRVLMVGVQ